MASKIDYNAEVRKRASHTGTVKMNGGTPEQIADAYQALDAIKAERTVAELVSTWPNLTDDRRARIAALLVAGGAK